MAAPNYEQIQSFDHVTKQLQDAAVDEFMSELAEGMSRDEVVELATIIADKYRLLGAELGAQWYDLCSELAGYDVEPAELQEQDVDSIAERAESATTRASETGDYYKTFADWLSDEIMSSIRSTGDANLWRDYRRGMAGGKWCRVPVGETCAWCLMLASQGAWYLSEKTALGTEPDHYHKDCNCKAVYHADAESIEGYKDLQKYKSMYYKAENTLDSGNMPDELQDRINMARLAHEQKVADYKAGLIDKEPARWTRYNETLIIMRYQNEGLK